MTTKPIRSVVVNFSDGSQLTLIAKGEEGTSYYKREDFQGLFDTHSIFMVDVLEREMPGF